MGRARFYERRLYFCSCGKVRKFIVENCGHVPHREFEGTVLQKVEVFLQANFNKINQWLKVPHIRSFHSANIIFSHEIPFFDKLDLGPFG